MTEKSHLIITADEAEALLAAGDRVHNVGKGPVLIGCDWDRAEAISTIREATQVALAGAGLHRAMRHPIAVAQKSGRLSFFEADMGKVAAFERARSLT